MFIENICLPLDMEDILLDFLYFEWQGSIPISYSISGFHYLRTYGHNLIFSALFD